MRSRSQRRVSRGRQYARDWWTRPARSPYRARRALLSRGELAFYRVLRTAVGTNVGIAVKVRLADVVWCPPRLFRRAAGARVSQKHLDFVLYDLRSTAVVLSVELDDRSHACKERRTRDIFVDEVLARCGIPLLRVRAAAAYSERDLRARLQASLCDAMGPRRHRRIRET